jgi:hypothetical protein
MHQQPANSQFLEGADTQAERDPESRHDADPHDWIPAAIELVDECLAVEGVDGILIGSNDICQDICQDMGIPGQYDNPAY